MWTTVLLFGLALNFEPNRLGLIALMLTRKRPIPQLMVFLGTAFLISGSVGLAVLFVFQHGWLASVNINGAAIQLGIGISVLVLAIVLALKPRWLPVTQMADTSSARDEPEPANSHRPRRIDQLATRVRDVAQGESPWLSGIAGASIAMPSVDYMALLALIVSSNTSALTQVVALFTFMVLGSLASLIPIVGYLVAPQQTRDTVQKFNTWIRSRRRRDMIILLGVVGTTLVLSAVANL